MSFGWSAGDIATAIKVAFDLIQALDSVDGAAGDYREAVTFLRSLTRTLEPLQTFTAWNAYPTYGKDIDEQVEYIKEPVERFLAAVLKYEPGLGVTARQGHHRHFLRKLQWYLFMSKRVLSLRSKIESHMRVIDTLMQRFTLDMVWTTQQQLPTTLRAVFRNILRPELLNVLAESLPPLTSEVLANYQERQTKNHEALLTKITEHHEDLSSHLVELKQQINNPRLIQQDIQSSISGNNINTRKAPCRSESYISKNSITSYNQPVDKPTDLLSETEAQESLHEVSYYLIFLYLGHFLKNLMLALSRLFQPSRALMPTLLAKYNILFLDAIGRQPRVLPYDCFRSFTILQAFIQYEFKSLPGTLWVDRGRYVVSSLANSKTLNEQNWESSIAPGATIAMSMLVRNLESSVKPDLVRCPEPSCSGKWKRARGRPWVTCPVCEKEILNSIIKSSTHPERRTIQTTSGENTTVRLDDSKELDEREIITFKRIAPYYEASPLTQRQYDQPGRSIETPPYHELGPEPFFKDPRMSNMEFALNNDARIRDAYYERKFFEESRKRASRVETR